MGDSGTYMCRRLFLSARGGGIEGCGCECGFVIG